MATMKKVIAKSAEGYPLLGNCIYWSFSEMKLSYEAFKAMLTECDISTDFAPQAKKKSAVIRAAEVLVKEQKDKGLKVLRTKSLDNDDAMVLSIFIERKLVSEHDTPAMQFETKIIFNKQTLAVTVTGNDTEAKERFDTIVADFLESYTTEQLRAAVLSYLKTECRSVMVRENGGLYFIPSTKEVEFKKLSDLFAKLASISACEVGSIPVIDTGDAAKAMWKALTSEVEVELRDMADEVGRLVGGKQTSAHEQARLEKIQNLTTKIEMYSTLLNGTADGLQKKLQGIHAAYIEKISQ